MDSKKIISTLLADLKSYVDDNTVVFETYRMLPQDLEMRENIPRARVAICHGAETDIIKVGAGKPADSRQAYLIDISVLKAYRNDDGSKGELPALDLRDDVVKWSQGVDAFHVTDGQLHSFEYEGSTPFFRNKKYVTLTLSFSGFRDLVRGGID